MRPNFGLYCVNTICKYWIICNIIIFIVKWSMEIHFRGKVNKNYPPSPNHWTWKIFNKLIDKSIKCAEWWKIVVLENGKMFSSFITNNKTEMQNCLTRLLSEATDFIHFPQITVFQSKNFFFKLVSYVWLKFLWIFHMWNLNEYGTVVCSECKLLL